ncbi:MAG: T9SS type A sorting domain-containing protein [bacterium]
MFTLPASVNTMKRAAFVSFLLLLSVVTSTAQAQSLTIGSVDACAAPEVLVPVTGTNLVNIGAITLFITFDSTRLSYKAVENIDPQLNGIVYTLNTTPFQLAIVWTNTNPISFQQKKLFDVRFTFKGQSSPVTFKAGCEISNSQLQILPVNYIGGSVASLVPQVTRQPKDTVVRMWALANFSTTATNAQNYLWKQSSDNGLTWNELSDNEIYQGTRTGQLTLSWAPPTYNKYRYMCSLNLQNCTAITQQATLTVDTLASVPVHATAKDFLLMNQPNPVTGYTTIIYTLPSEGGVSLEILDLCGNIVAQPVTEFQAKGLHHIIYNATGLKTGFYFYRLNFTGGNASVMASGKMIKID